MPYPRFRLVLALLVGPLLAEAAAAIDRTSTADCVWASLPDGCSWTGAGTPGASDNYTIAHDVTVSGELGITTGGITIAPGGTLRVGAGTALQYGDGSAPGGNPPGVGLVIESGGTLIQAGSLLKTCRLVSAVDWSLAVAATHAASAVTTCDLADVSTSADYVFFGDEDPSDLDAVLTGRCVQRGPGSAKPGCYRPAYNKWASYKITGASGRTLTWDLDPLAGYYVGTPYAGSRYAPAAAGVAGDALAYTLRWLGRRTLVSVPNAYSADVAITAADRGSWYLAYDEIPGYEEDPAVCSGLHAKILNATDGGGGPDLLEVQGDVSGCTSGRAVARLTPGARRGDLVHIYRPATLNGNTLGATTTVGEGSIANTGGFWYARWARLTNQWGADAGDWTPAAGRAGNIQFIQGTPTAQPSADWDWVDIAYSAYTGGGDSADLHFISAIGSTNLRYPDHGMLDVSGSPFRHLHIHDWLNNAAGGGGHGIYVDTARGVDVAQVRVERINDDCIGSKLVRSDGTALQDSSITLRHALVYECIAPTANSQQGIELAVENDGSATHNPALHSGIVLQDVLSMGHALTPFESHTYNRTFKGITTGGMNAAAAVGGPSARAVALRIAGSGYQAAFAEPTLGFAVANANRVYDSNLYVLGPTSHVSPIEVAGELRGTFVAGYDQLETTAARFGYAGMLDRSVVDLDDNLGSGGYYIIGGGTAPFHFKAARFVDSVLRSTSPSAYGALANGLVSLADSGFHHTIRRLALLMPHPNEAPWGILANLATGGMITDSTTTIDGLFVTSNQPTPATFISETGAGVDVDVNAACLEGTDSGAVFGGESANGTTRIVADPLPPASSDAVLLRDLVVSPDPSCRGQNLPTALGYVDFRVGHAMLGDFEIRDIARSSSDDLITSQPPDYNPPYGGCGLGPELVLVAPLLLALRRRWRGLALSSRARVCGGCAPRRTPPAAR